MKKMFLLMAFIIAMAMGAVAQAQAQENDVNINVGDLLRQSNAVVYVQSCDLEIGREEEGGNIVHDSWNKVDRLIGFQQMVANNKKVDFTVASPLSKKMRISALILDKKDAVKLHYTMLATNRQTAAKQVGQIFRWGTEKYTPSEALQEELLEVGIKEPVKMTVIATKQKDKESMLVKAIKGAVAVTGLIKTARDWNNDYADLTPLLTSALMIQSIAGGGQNGMMSPMSTSAQMYAVDTATLAGGF